MLDSKKGLINYIRNLHYNESLYTFNNNISYGTANNSLANFSEGEIRVEDCNFTQNYAGQRGAAINLENIQRSRISIRNVSFFNNTGAYSFFEEEHSLPFYEWITMRQYKLNYVKHSNSTNCLNEIQSFGSPECFHNAYNTSARSPEEPTNPLENHQLHIQYP